jgi:hypothetical protein
LLPVSEAGSSLSLVSVTSSRPSDSEGTLSLLASAARNQTYQMIKKTCLVRRKQELYFSPKGLLSTTGLLVATGELSGECVFFSAVRTLERAATAAALCDP